MVNGADIYLNFLLRCPVSFSQSTPPLLGAVSNPVQNSETMALPVNVQQFNIYRMDNN